MNQPFYDFTILAPATRFDFYSVGKRVIHKTIIYQKTDIPNVYNLLMGDINNLGEIDVFNESRNGDRDKVLATVAQTIIHFFESKPDAKVAFSGSSSHRTRLYQIAIAHELENISQRFIIWGFNGNYFEPFVRNKRYEGFVIEPAKL